MKEHPIIFNTEMVKAIQDGRKTQTRRLSGLEKINETPDKWELCTTAEEWDGKLDDAAAVFFPVGNFNEGWAEVPFCPYGQVGDRLWVRETWACARRQDDLPPREVSQETGFLAYKACPEDISYCLAGKWRPSIHMPRWASRITLEITGIRVERVQDISESDCMKEGLDMSDVEYKPFGDVVKFKSLWDSINAKRGSWADNPFVWVVEFTKE